jgi:hypothetical protein
MTLSPDLYKSPKIHIHPVGSRAPFVDISVVDHLSGGQNIYFASLVVASTTISSKKSVEGSVSDNPMFREAPARFGI